MKTSELIERIGKEKLLIYKKEDSREVHYIRVFTEKVLDSESEYVAEIGCIGQWLILRKDCPQGLAIFLMDYNYTPLEEREEQEKKYRLKFPSGYNQILTYLGLSLRGFDCVGIECSELYQTQFTQKEIDAMPFDTNFFIKEEVSEK